MLQTKKSVVVVIVDIILSVIIVGSLVAFVWRGLWTALDVFLFPDSKVTSMWSSLAIGHGIVLLAYGLQYQMANVSRRLKRNVERIIWEDIFIFVASIGGINVWRGLWMFADVYILPGTRNKIFLLMGIQCSLLM